MIDWNDIRYVVAVAGTGSTLAAAQALRVSQPTVARRIAAIEDAIGLRLFDRLASGYQPTSVCTALLPSARAIEEAARRFESEADAHRRRLSGTVRLTAAPVIADLYVAPALKRFRELYPDIRVEIFAEDRTLDLEAGEADIAIRSGPRPTEGKLVARRLARDSLTLFCSRDYGEAHGVPGSVAELDGHTILLGTGPLEGSPFYRWLRDAAPGAEQGYPANSVAAHIASVRAGHGIGAMPRRLFGHDPDLIACFDAPDEVSVETWLIAPERLRDEPAVRALLDFIGAYRGDTPAGLTARMRKAAS